MCLWKLDEASAAVLLIYGENEENTKILFGITNEAGDHYARLSDSEMVYTVDSQALDSLMNADMSVMYDKAVLKSDFENIIYAYAVSEKGEYVISDSATPGEAQENLWEKLSDIKAHEKTDAEGEYVTLLKVYAKNADGIEITAEFSEYSYEYYILTVNGETKYLVDADPVDQIIRYANSMIAY